ncbi:unnamed protein product [Orchesella dallaii]|uniref:Uncharacterized protein n=1 Tax=Orchesella dallaii TaxID=48710 RepID=A0ABP1RY53_9HEXA
MDTLFSDKNISKANLDSHLGNSEPHKENLPVANLNKIRSPFKSCFVHLTNFQGVDILPTNYALVLRRLHVVPSYFKQTSNLRDLLIFAPIGTPSRGEPHSDNSSSEIFDVSCALFPLFTYSIPNPCLQFAEFLKVLDNFETT